MDNKDICLIIDEVSSFLKGNIKDMSLCDASAAADILKDITESKKNLCEAEYYNLISKAMKEEKEYPYNQRMGYSHVINEKPYIDAYMRRDQMEADNDRNYSDYGISYDEYKNAKRHFTETNSIQDKDDMEKHAIKHVDKSIESIKDIWKDLPIAHKSRMKDELTNLAESLPIM